MNLMCVNVLLLQSSQLGSQVNVTCSTSGKTTTYFLPGASGSQIQSLCSQQCSWFICQPDGASSMHHFHVQNIIINYEHVSEPFLLYVYNTFYLSILHCSVNWPFGVALNFPIIRAQIEFSVTSEVIPIQLDVFTK